MKNLVLTPLDYYQLIEVRGSDAKRFLQNQLSNDIQLLSDSRSQLSSYSSAKGMMFANFRIIQQGERYLLRIPSDVAEAVVKRLRMFVLRDDVHINPAEGTTLLGVCGPDSLSALVELGFTLPEEQDEVSQHQNQLLVRCLNATGEVRFELIATQAYADSLQNQMTGSSDDYLAAQLRAGEAFINTSSYEQFVAQNLNLELINGVSFKKGCYPGQEYIARTQYRGQVRSRCYLIGSDSPLTPGTVLFETGKTDGDNIGQVINSVPQDQHHLALAVIRNKVVDKNAVCLADGSAIALHALPYALTAPDE